MPGENVVEVGRPIVEFLFLFGYERLYRCSNEKVEIKS